MRPQSILFVLACSAASLACGSEIAPPAGGGSANSASPDAGSGKAAAPGAANSGSSEPGAETGTTTQTAAPDFSGCSASPTPSCGAPTSFSTASELVAIIDALPWQPAHAGSSYAFTVSADLVATAKVDVSASALAPEVAGNCAVTFDDTKRCADTVFRAGTYTGNKVSVPGVSCNGSVEIPRGVLNGCASLSIPAGTHLRLRKVVQDVHPYAPTYWPIVEVERPCTEACGADEARCGASQTCFAKGAATCLYCHARDVAVCACQGECSVQPDGTKCWYDTSPDTGVVGACRSGTCK